MRKMTGSDSAWRQTHLGLSSDNTLTIIDGRIRSVLVNPGENYLLRLPDELLVDIVQLAICEERPQPRWVSFVAKSEFECECEFTPNIQCAKTLSRLCHRLRNIVQPALYLSHTIHSPSPMEYNGHLRPCVQTIKLRRRLEQDMCLAQICKVYKAELPVFLFEQRNYYEELQRGAWIPLQRLPNLKCVRLDAVGVDAWGVDAGLVRFPFVREVFQEIVTSMRLVQHLTLQCFTVETMHPIKWPALKRLDLDLVHPDAQLLRALYQARRTAPFSSLSITTWFSPPEALALLLQWPNRLEHLQLGGLFSNEDPFTFTELLSAHCETLQSVDLTNFRSNKGADLLDGTLFPKLESVQVSRRLFGRDFGPGYTRSITLGPKTEFFGMDFGNWDEVGEWRHITERQAMWLHDLYSSAVKRKTALKMIGINFNPHYEIRQRIAQAEYPWDRLNRLRDELMHPNGIELEYSTPTVSKAWWMEDAVDWQRKMDESTTALTIDEHGGESDATAQSIGDTQRSDETFAIVTGAQWGDVRDYFERL
ncbi:hypothetical protein CC80DRAFT_532991 [Byssothecium circinans]|uniref:Uncharacterized protein n=1 Tax=Byssothecium circinans TaxID=147558 RepID=A0A6A5U5K7_9PLEO|nr:hypothetical protein CC80DRAFT_532991 [Byssothecium circinans]